MYVCVCVRVRAHVRVCLFKLSSSYSCQSTKTDLTPWLGKASRGILNTALQGETLTCNTVVKGSLQQCPRRRLTRSQLRGLPPSKNPGCLTGEPERRRPSAFVLGDDVSQCSLVGRLSKPSWGKKHPKALRTLAACCAKLQQRKAPFVSKDFNPADLSGAMLTLLRHSGSPRVARRGRGLRLSGNPGHQLRRRHWRAEPEPREQLNF